VAFARDEAVRRVPVDVSAALRDLDAQIVDAHRQLDGRGGELSRVLTDADRTVRQVETLLGSLNGVGVAEPRLQFRPH
jgi:hypothetical protein